jgi:hypothetical protein
VEKTKNIAMSDISRRPFYTVPNSSRNWGLPIELCVSVEKIQEYLSRSEMVLNYLAENRNSQMRCVFLFDNMGGNCTEAAIAKTILESEEMRNKYKLRSVHVLYTDRIPCKT